MLPGDGRVPDGELFRAAGPSEDGWTMIVAIHESRESWERFRDGVLLPRLTCRRSRAAFLARAAGADVRGAPPGRPPERRGNEPRLASPLALAPPLALALGPGSCAPCLPGRGAGGAPRRRRSAAAPGLVTWLETSGRRRRRQRLLPARAHEPSPATPAPSPAIPASPASTCAAGASGSCPPGAMPPVLRAW